MGQQLSQMNFESTKAKSKTSFLISIFYFHFLLVNKNYFDFKYVIGKGGFGKVWKAVLKKTQKVYALKEMSKVKIIDKKSEKSIKMERKILEQVQHP